ncbi:pyridoxamine 5'-phosphate oxidase family protein [Aquimarina sp. 2201CG1-2-11]|uniref:pyridoxamine 5'-phosphate oxidase family protein n=1 Tax=Aquimarina discodermiae TaxID=3231043 RepID=UPI0034625FEE
MAKMYTKISKEQEEFIANQKIFFVGTAATEGSVNISPKGMDTFRVINANQIIWLNLTGSGNETAAHLLKNKRMTIMFCAFEGKPLILRLYGNAEIYHEKDSFYQEHIHQFPKIEGSRQIIKMQINKVQTSCGYAVPFMEFQEERTQLQSWAEKQGKDRLRKYQEEKNSISIDGFDTGWQRK